MPAYQLRLVEQREERQTLYQQRISEQIDDCTEIAKSNIRNHVEKFLIAQGSRILQRLIILCEEHTKII